MLSSSKYLYSFRVIFLGCGLLLSINYFILLSGCGELQCGDGTVSIGGKCVSGAASLECPKGFTVKDNRCVPESADWPSFYCDPETAEYKDGKCTAKEAKCDLKSVCPDVCPEASTESICIQGRIFRGFDAWFHGVDSAQPLTPADNVTLYFYDAVTIWSSPDGKPLYTAKITNDKGCFIFEKVSKIPFNWAFFQVKENDNPKEYKKWSPFTTSFPFKPGQNDTGRILVAFTKQDIDSWNLPFNFLDTGFLILHFVRDEKSLIPVAGVTPTILDKPYPDPV